MNSILAKKLSRQKGSTWVRTLVCETEDMTGWLRDLDFVLGDCEHGSAIGRVGKKGEGQHVCFILFPQRREKIQGQGVCVRWFLFLFQVQ